MKAESNELKEEIYKIFNNIQTRTETKENLELLLSIFERKTIKAFNECLENIFLIIFNHYDKNNLALKNIKEFLKAFLEKIVKIPKLKDTSKCFIKHFCQLFTGNAKKPKYKSLCIYFLSIFLSPYTNNFKLFYDSETLDEIKVYILNTLRAKQSSLHISAMKLLQKHPDLQKDPDIWERVEALLNGPNKNIKKEILKLLEVDDDMILKYILDMYDDDSAEIRQFVFEKLCKIKDFRRIDSKKKVKLLFVGLNDTSLKVQQSAKRFFKNYLNFLGIFKRKALHEEGKMDICEDSAKKNLFIGKSPSVSKLKKETHSSDDEEDSEMIQDKNEDVETVQDKICKSTSPMKHHGKKLTDSPSRVFDELEIGSFYNHPKYSFAFQLITEAMIEMIDKEDLVGYIKSIVENMVSITHSETEIRYLSTEKKRKRPRDEALSQFSSSGKINRVDKYALFNDIYFLQSKFIIYYMYIDCITHFSTTKSTDNVGTMVLDCLPDVKTFTQILEYFYTKEANVFILHQIFIIMQIIHYNDEIGTRDILSFIKKFISDTSLANKKLTDYSFRKITFNSLDVQPEEPSLIIEREINEERKLQFNLDNLLLPMHRKVILSMEDLVEYALKVMLIIHYNKHSQLFASIMEIINELNEMIDISNEHSLKHKQKELIDQIKEKRNIIESHEEKKRETNTNRLENRKSLNIQNKQIDELEEKLVDITHEEECILYRILKLCEFAIQYCKVPSPMFDTMLQEFMISTLQRKQFSSVMQVSYKSMGLLALNHFQSNYKNFLKLYFDNLNRFDSYEFKDLDLVTLLIIFDSLLQNNLQLLSKEIMSGSLDEKIDLIIKKYLYHSQYTPRIIAFLGLCKLLIANRTTRPEFILSRLIVALFQSFNVIDRASEDYNIKIYEIMNNFMYFYLISGKPHAKAVVQAVIVILTSHLMFTGENSYAKNVICEYLETKFEFLNQVLNLVYENSADKANMPYIKLIFKIFKYICFVNSYINDDQNTKQGKNIRISYNLIKNFKNQIKKFFEKSNYDKTLFNIMKENESFLKLFPFLISFEDTPISEFLTSSLKEFKENGSKIDINGTVYDLGNQEKLNEMKDYVSNKEMKYFKRIEENYVFLSMLKEDKLNVIFEENSKLYEEEDMNASFNQKESGGNLSFGNGKKKKSPRRKEKKTGDASEVKDEIGQIEKISEKEKEPEQEELQTSKRSGKKRKSSQTGKRNILKRKKEKI